MKIVGIIPARYASSRFPGKPLALIKGTPMIQWVYEKCQMAEMLSDIIVATDDQKIREAVIRFGGKAMLTATHHNSGTDRCAEVLASLEDSDNKFDVVVNIQGDEPGIDPEQINLVSKAFLDPGVKIATLAKSINDPTELFNPNVVKVVVSKNNQALYFSRQALPYLRNSEQENWSREFLFYKHIGLYAYRPETLMEITKLEASRLEMAESLEQLRWLENGFQIHVNITEKESISIDTPEDLSKFSNIC